MKTVISRPKPVLVNAPLPAMDESASSWLSRLSISQGSTLKQVMSFLEIPSTPDIDSILVGPQLDSIRRKCGLPSSALSWHDAVMSRLPEIGALGSTFLLQDKAGRPLAHFCPECLGEMFTPYFPIHWRFNIWQWCPLHDRQLDVACHQCNRQPFTLVDIANTRSGKKGIAHLNRCMHCGKKLTTSNESASASSKFEDLPALQRRRISNARALLSALYHGWFRTWGPTEKHSLSALEEIAKNRDFPLPLKTPTTNAGGDAQQSASAWKLPRRPPY